MYEVEGKAISVAKMDEDYQMIDAHKEPSLKAKIQNFEYIDLSKLITRNRSGGVREEESHFEFIHKNGQTFLSLLSERDYTQISSYPKWEQAFRIYSNILTSKYPSKATELLQYNHTIHSASQSYHWDNVYAYDKEFRYHIARHPVRSWAIILQQAWTMLLKDRLKNDNSLFQRGTFTGNGKQNKRDKEPCRQFNRGKCTFSLSCKFDHHCSVPKCGKFCHGAHICHLRDADNVQNRTAKQPREQDKQANK